MGCQSMVLQVRQSWNQTTQPNEKIRSYLLNDSIGIFATTYSHENVLNIYGIYIKEFS